MRFQHKYESARQKDRGDPQTGTVWILSELRLFFVFAGRGDWVIKGTVALAKGTSSIWRFTREGSQAADAMADWGEIPI